MTRRDRPVLADGHAADGRDIRGRQVAGPPLGAGDGGMVPGEPVPGLEQEVVVVDAGLLPHRRGVAPASAPGDPRWRDAVGDAVALLEDQPPQVARVGAVDDPQPVQGAGEDQQLRPAVAGGGPLQQRVDALGGQILQSGAAVDQQRLAGGVAQLAPLGDLAVAPPDGEGQHPRERRIRRRRAEGLARQRGPLGRAEGLEVGQAPHAAEQIRDGDGRSATRGGGPVPPREGGNRRAQDRAPLGGRPGPVAALAAVHLAHHDLHERGVGGGVRPGDRQRIREGRGQPPQRSLRGLRPVPRVPRAEAGDQGGEGCRLRRAERRLAVVAAEVERPGPRRAHRSTSPISRTRQAWISSMPRASFPASSRPLRWI